MDESVDFLDNMSLTLSPMPDCNFDDLLGVPWGSADFLQPPLTEEEQQQTGIGMAASTFNTPPRSDASPNSSQHTLSPSYNATADGVFNAMDFEAEINDISELLQLPANQFAVSDLPLPPAAFNLTPAASSPSGSNDDFMLSPAYNLSSDENSPMQQQLNADALDVDVDELLRQFLPTDNRSMKLERNTPSPTGSCGSSSGASSSSGIQSDDACSSSQGASEQMDYELAITANAIPVEQTSQASIKPELSASQTVTSMQPMPVLNLISSGTLIPVQTVPLNAAYPPQTPIPSAAPPAKASPPRVEHKLAPKAKASTTPTAVVSKPKTVVLSQSDFKALMQKMSGNKHTNGGSKIIIKDAQGKIIGNNTKFVANRQSVPSLAKPQTPAKPPANVKKPAEIVDEKLLKKQARMIKNRESASLSRKKKKEYMESLETRIGNLEKENTNLKTENTTLRNQLAAIARACKCRNGNVSQFVLDSLNAKDDKLLSRASSNSKSLKQRLNATTSVKRNVAVLLAMAVMVTFNVGSLHTYLSKDQSLDFGEHIEAITEDVTGGNAGGNHLVPLEAAAQYSAKHNRTRRSLENSRPPSLQPLSGGGCMTGNQTDNMRVAENLHKWIDNQNLNSSMRMKYAGVELANSHGFKLPEDDYLGTNYGRYLGKRKAATYLAHDTDTDSDSGSANERLQAARNAKRLRMNLNEAAFMDTKSMKLLDGIKRRDDSFYVLSLNRNNLLLSASAYNNSAPPKMSLLLPASDFGEGGDLKLIQIDCKVVNTTEVELKADMIPESLLPGAASEQQPTHVINRKLVFGNKQRMEERAASSDKQIKVEPEPEPEAETDFDLLGEIKTEKFGENQMEVDGGLNATLVRMPPIKQLQRSVRTYVMMGPKTAKEAAKSGEQPRFVKLNQSQPLEPHDFDNRSANSKLFNKITEIVGFGGGKYDLLQDVD